MTDTTLETVAARQEIAQLLYRYCRSVDRLDIPLGHSIFHDDAEVDYGPDVYQGPARGVIDYICGTHAYFISHSHQVTNVTIEVDGARANSEAYVTVNLRTVRDGRHSQISIWARYLDRWSKRDGHWAIDRRLMVQDLDEMRDVTPVSTTSRGTRDQEDPSYRFLTAAAAGD